MQPLPQQWRHLASRDSPPCPSPGVHIPVYGLVDPIRLLVIRLVCCPSEEAIFVVWVLKLVRVDLRLLTAPRLSFSVIPKLVSYVSIGCVGARRNSEYRTAAGRGVEERYVRDCLCRRTLACWADIRPGRKS